MALIANEYFVVPLWRKLTRKIVKNKMENYLSNFISECAHEGVADNRDEVIEVPFAVVDDADPLPDLPRCQTRE